MTEGFDDSIRNVFGLRPRLVKSFAGIMESDTGRPGFFHRGEQGWMDDGLAWRLTMTREISIDKYPLKENVYALKTTIVTIWS